MEEAALRPRAKFFQIDDVPGTRSEVRLELCRLICCQVPEVHFSQVLLAFQLDGCTTDNTRVTSSQNCGVFRARQKL